MAHTEAGVGQLGARQPPQAGFPASSVGGGGFRGGAGRVGGARGWAGRTRGLEGDLGSVVKGEWAGCGGG